MASPECGSASDGDVGHLPTRHGARPRAQRAGLCPGEGVLRFGVRALDPGPSLPQRHSPRRRIPTPTGPAEQAGIPHRLRGGGPDGVDRRPPHTGHPRLAGRVVDLQAGIGGAGEEVAVLGSFVPGRGHHGLALGHRLLEHRRLGLDIRRGELRLALPPAGGDHLGAVVVHHLDVGVERTGPSVGPDVDLDRHTGRHADDHLDVEGGLARTGAGVGTCPVDADRTHRRTDGGE